MHPTKRFYLGNTFLFSYRYNPKPRRRVKQVYRDEQGRFITLGRYRFIRARTIAKRTVILMAVTSIVGGCASLLVN